ncbi:MAG: hypothetical protein L6R28_08365 [Planctomycetes bacterium]|nr:hypothetical protein [Planctomycetota bacterium]
MRPFFRGKTRPAWAYWFAAAAYTFLLVLAASAFSRAAWSQPLDQTALGASLFALLKLAWIGAVALALVRRVLAIEWTPFAVARTVLSEAFRYRVAWVFVALMALLLAALPAGQDATTPLRYRVQTFLSYGFGFTALLLSLLTIFLACATLCGEVADKRIFTVVCKPVGRGAYLIGKWLGIVLLNAALLCAAGAGLYGFANSLGTQQGIDEDDTQAVAEQVLTARVAVAPRAPEGLIERIVEDRLTAFKEQEREKYEEWGELRTRAELRQRADSQWRSVGPGERQTYLFDGLQDAKASGADVQLRYRMRVSKAPPDGRMQLTFELGKRSTPVQVRTGAWQVFTVAPANIGDDGRLELVVYNRHPDETHETTILFPPGEGLEVLYRAGAFGPNLARALLILWIKLAFLAMLGLLCATFLGFHVAILVSLIVFATAASSGFLLYALKYFGENEPSVAVKTLSGAVRGIGTAAATLLQKFSDFAPGTDLVDGRLVPWSEVLACAGWIGLLWTGACGLAGWIVFARRELGRVQV